MIKRLLLALLCTFVMVGVVSSTDWYYGCVSPSGYLQIVQSHAECGQNDTPITVPATMPDPPEPVELPYVPKVYEADGTELGYLASFSELYKVGRHPFVVIITDRGYKFSVEIATGRPPGTVRPYYTSSNCTGQAYLPEMEARNGWVFLDHLTDAQYYTPNHVALGYVFPRSRWDIYGCQQTTGGATYMLPVYPNDFNITGVDLKLYYSAPLVIE